MNKYNNLHETLLTQIAQQRSSIKDITGINETDKPLYLEKYHQLTSYFQLLWEEFVKGEMTLLFDPDHHCSLSFNYGILPITNPATLNKLQLFREHYDDLPPEALETIANDEEFMVGNIVGKPNKHMISYNVGNQAYSRAVIAYKRTIEVIELLSQVKTTANTATDKSIQLLMIAFSKALEAEKHLRIALQLHFEAGGTTEETRNYLIEVEKGVKKHISDVARERTALVQKNNYKRQRQIIKIYESGNYKVRYNTSNKKTETARYIVKEVNAWCVKENIPPLSDTDCGGVKTVKLCIERYKKNIEPIEI